MIRRPPESPLFPSTPLFRSLGQSRSYWMLRMFTQNRQEEPAEVTQRRTDALALRVREHLPDDGNLVNEGEDRKSTRLNSSHANISYAVFCLKKKKISNPLHH